MTNIWIADDHDEHITWGDWSTRRDDRGAWSRTVPATLVDGATGSDYSGGSVARSNYRVIMADRSLEPHIVTISGGHDTYGIAFLGHWDDLPKVCREVIGALADYPLLSDDDHSALECDEEQEAWCSHGAADFARALVEEVGLYGAETDGEEWVHRYEIDEPNLSESDLWALWTDLTDRYNSGERSIVRSESEGVCFDTERVLKHATYDDLVPMGLVPAPIDHEIYDAIERALTCLSWFTLWCKQADTTPKMIERDLLGKLATMRTDNLAAGIDVMAPLSH